VPSPTYKFVLRLSEDLRERIAEAARLYRRSMNSEIVVRLEQSLSGVPDREFEVAVEPPFFPHMETAFRRDLSDEEDRLIRLFRRLSAKQRAALLDLLG